MPEFVTKNKINFNLSQNREEVDCIGNPSSLG